MTYAHNLLENGQGERALGPLEEALAIDPNFPYALSYKGAILVGLERFDEGLAAIKRILELLPGYPQALYNGACAYALQGDGETALEWLEQAFQTAPGLREEARRDPHFESLQGQSKQGQRFRELVG